MRAKRSKKYRKTMSAYQLAFSFREPYQVLLDAAFVRTCHTFHMPLQKYLDNTLHGQCRIYVTKCTLAKIMAEYIKSGGYPKSRPDFLPPPTELPLRHCSHKDDEGEEVGVLDETQCLLDLLAGQPHGNEMPKNKQHYILATADAPEWEQNRKRFINVREKARIIPGVPIVYVKRSVMILEEMSGTSEHTRLRQEKEKFREGLVGDRKRKRGEGDDEAADDISPNTRQDHTLHHRGNHKPKGPNPLSVPKKKIRNHEDAQGDAAQTQEEDNQPKKRRRGKRGKKATIADEVNEVAVPEVD